MRLVSTEAGASHNQGEYACWDEACGFPAPGVRTSSCLWVLNKCNLARTLVRDRAQRAFSCSIIQM